MKLVNDYFDVNPQIIPADSEVTIEITPRYHHGLFCDDREYEINYYPAEEFALRSGWKPINSTCVRPVDGRIRFRQYFEGEQEHILVLDQVSPDRVHPLEFRLYSLHDDLYGRTPLKGDFHMHSNRSDGWEPPAYVAAAARRIGMDFMAVTDHRKYAPSLEAIRAFEDLDIGLRIFPGEEVHPPDNPVHIINFGGRYSINDLFDDEAVYRHAVANGPTAREPFPEGVDPFQYASCAWTFDRIREAGGLGILCHPYWFTSYRYAPSGALTSYLFERQPFDALELIGGFHKWEADSNTLQVARYHEERSKGRRIPIVGSSDAHGCERNEMFSWFYSIVFAPSADLPDIISSVKELYSVAVEAMEGETARAYGPFRLVKYALFLLRERFPRHDEACRREAERMFDHLREKP